MVNSLDDAFRFHQQALELRSYRQQLLASNIANADTPGYKARDIDFARALRAAVDNSASSSQLAAQLTTTAPGHMAAAADSPGADKQVMYRTPTQTSIDGNTVEMDAERAQFADNAVRMEADLTFINSQIKMLLAAVQA